MNKYKKCLNVIPHLMRDLGRFQIKSGMTRGSFLLFIIILTCVSIGIFVNKGVAQEKTQQQYDVACEVTDVTSLQDCVKKAKNKEYDLIRIMNVIECVSKDECAVDLSDVEKAIKIYGINNTDTGFRRTGNFDYSLFTIKNSKDIVIGSFIVDDTGNGDCSASGIQCPPVLHIENSKNIMVDQLRTKSAKNNAVSVATSSAITIKNSDFSNTGGAAVLFSAESGENFITNNILTHNHNDALFDGCLGVCIGAQMTILPNTKNLTISRNTIKDGRIDIYDPLGLYISGIEIAGENVENIQVSCNKIFQNTGNGIVVNQQSTATNITVEKNSVYENGIDMNVLDLPGNSIDKNCFDASCKVDGC